MIHYCTEQSCVRFIKAYIYDTILHIESMWEGYKSIHIWYNTAQSKHGRVMGLLWIFCGNDCVIARLYCTVWPDIGIHIVWPSCHSPQVHIDCAAWRFQCDQFDRSAPHNIIIVWERNNLTALSTHYRSDTNNVSAINALQHIHIHDDIHGKYWHKML